LDVIVFLNFPPEWEEGVKTKTKSKR